MYIQNDILKEIDMFLTHLLICVQCNFFQLQDIRLARFAHTSRTVFNTIITVFFIN